MSEPIVPIIRLPVRPENVTRLEVGSVTRLGGIRMRTTIYVVQEADMPGGIQNIVPLTIPVHAAVELKVIE